MPHSPKIQIKCEIDYKPNFTVEASEFEGINDTDLEEAVREHAEEVMRANLSIYVENMPLAVKEIREALRHRKEEEELDQ